MNSTTERHDDDNPAVRNRAIKKVLGSTFGRGNIAVRGSRGTGYGYVNVDITLPGGERSEARDRAYALLRAAGIDDAGCNIFVDTMPRPQVIVE